jgi:hypothetical protein
LPESAAAQNPAVKITRVFTHPDPSKVREFADDMRDGKFILPIGRRMPLRDAAEAHVLGDRVLGVDENDELIDELKKSGPDSGEKQTFSQMILENLKTAGVQQAHI